MTNNTSRDKIFQSIKQHLGKLNTPPSPTPPIAPTIDFSSLKSEKDRDLCQLFITEAEASQSTVAKVQSLKEVPKAVSTYLQQQKRPPIIWGWQEYQHLDWVAVGIEFHAEKIDKQMPVAETNSLTGVDFAIAETGTLVIQSSPTRPLGHSLFLETHVVIVESGRIRYHLSDVLDNAFIDHPNKAQTVLISGPSRTADIEQTLVLGAHGPKHVHIIVIQEND